MSSSSSTANKLAFLATLFLVAQLGSAIFLTQDATYAARSDNYGQDNNNSGRQAGTYMAQNNNNYNDNNNNNDGGHWVQLKTNWNADQWAHQDNNYSNHADNQDNNTWQHQQDNETIKASLENTQHAWKDAQDEASQWKNASQELGSRAAQQQQTIDTLGAAVLELEAAAKRGDNCDEVLKRAMEKLDEYKDALKTANRRLKYFSAVNGQSNNDGNISGKANSMRIEMNKQSSKRDGGQVKYVTITPTASMNSGKRQENSGRDMNWGNNDADKHSYFVVGNAQ